MNQYVFGGLCLTLGLALGVSISFPPHTPLQTSVNYVRLKALHGLCTDYKKEKGNFPSSMTELEAWSSDHDVRREILEGTRRLQLVHDQAYKEWQIRPASDANPNAPLISSGMLPHADAEEGYETTIDAEGRITNFQFSRNR
jgi:hypothetical protein